MALCSRQKSSPTSCPRAAPRSFERRACFVGRRCRSARRPSRCCCRPAPSRPSSRRPGSPGRAAPAGSSSPSRVRVPCTELERGIPARYHVQSACVHASCNVPVFTVDRGTKASVIHEGPTQHFITIGSHSLSRTHARSKSTHARNHSLNVEIFSPDRATLDDVGRVQEIDAQLCQGCHIDSVGAAKILPAYRLQDMTRVISGKEFLARLLSGVRGTAETSLANPLSLGDIRGFMKLYRAAAD